VLGFFDDFDFVSFGGVDEGDPVAGGGGVGAVGEGQAQLRQVAGKLIEVIDGKGEVGEIRLNLHGSAVGKLADLDQFVTFGGLEEDQLGSAGGLMAVDFDESQNPGIKIHSAREVIDPVSCVQETCHNVHGGNIVLIPALATGKEARCLGKK